MAAQGLTSGRIADLVNGRLVGRSDINIAGVAPLDRAGPGDLSFLASRSYLEQYRRTKAGAVLVAKRFEDADCAVASRIMVSDVRLALARILPSFTNEAAVKWGVASNARIGRGTRWSGRILLESGAVLGQNVLLGPDCTVERHAVVEDESRIGKGCRIGAHAVVFRGTVLGDRVHVKSGARIGGSGFAYAESDAGHAPLSHVGGCWLEDDVEVGANTTIDRGSVGDTVVGAGTKIDNLVQVGHNVRIGKRCLIMAQAGLAGSTVLEDEVLLAGQAGLAGHLTVGRGARVAAQAGVIGDIAAGTTVSGYPARPHREVLRQAAALQKLAPLSKSLQRLLESDGTE